ncbi:MAG: Fpg/Nei family DNA glycosylase [Phycisphaerales bacterium]
MPEGHTIHRAARDQTRRLAGRALAASSPQGRFRAGARKLDGRSLEHIEAHGKHLFYRWEGGLALHVHLGLYGRFRLHRAPVGEPVGQVRLRLVGDAHVMDLDGPAACDLVDAKAEAKIRARLGEDPLRSDADPDRLWARVGRSRAPIGALLLDQSAFAGVGNIFRAESLFEIGVHPDVQGRDLGRERFDALWASLRAMMRASERINRIVARRPEEVGKPRSRMQGSERLRIYKKERCLRCGGAVVSWEQAAREVHACPACQPAPKS